MIWNASPERHGGCTESLANATYPDSLGKPLTTGENLIAQPQQRKQEKQKFRIRKQSWLRSFTECQSDLVNFCKD